MSSGMSDRRMEIYTHPDQQLKLKLAASPDSAKSPKKKWYTFFRRGSSRDVDADVGGLDSGFESAGPFSESEVMLVGDVVLIDLSNQPGRRVKAYLLRGAKLVIVSEVSFCVPSIQCSFIDRIP
jgi:hypothetical protein